MIRNPANTAPLADTTQDSRPGWMSRARPRLGRATLTMEKSEVMTSWARPIRKVMAPSRRAGGGGVAATDDESDMGFDPAVHRMYEARSANTTVSLITVSASRAPKAGKLASAMKAC